MGTICLNNIKVFAHHGIYEVEQKVGQWYLVNIELDTDFTAAAQDDDLEGTVDYSVINQIVLDQMAISSKLIEHVAARIAEKILDTFPEIEEGSVGISKLNPPVKGTMESVEVVFDF